MKLGVNSVDDLAKLKVSSIDDLAKIGIKNADDLAKLGIDSSDLKKLGIDPKVFERTAGSIKKVKYGEQFTKANRKKALKANIMYTDVNNYSYQTDSYGRIVKATTSDLKLGEGKRNPYAQRTVG